MFQILILHFIADRQIACYSSRSFTDSTDEGCNPFEGSPFKEFWNHIGVKSFDAGSLFYAPIYTDYNFAIDWIKKYKHISVLAFVGN